MLIFGPVLGDILHPKILAKNLSRHSLIGCGRCECACALRYWGGGGGYAAASDSSDSPWSKAGH